MSINDDLQFAKRTLQSELIQTNNSHQQPIQVSFLSFGDQKDDSDEEDNSNEADDGLDEYLLSFGEVFFQFKKNVPTFHTKVLTPHPEPLITVHTPPPKKYSSNSLHV